jgi:hypothetical protein
VKNPARAKLVLGAGLLSACGGGAPLMHPVHTLPADDVSFAAGTTGRFALGGLHDSTEALDAAAALPGGARTPEQRASFVRGSLTQLAVAPAVAPFVSARAGLGQHNEAGLSYTGRSFRIDGRHAFEWPSLALSIGAGATGTLAQPGHQPEHDINDPDVSGAGLRTLTPTSVRGYGLDVPVLFGYRSSADVVKLWAGLRAGFEFDSANVAVVLSPDSLVGTTASVKRYWGGGLLGFSVGLSPVEVRVEVDAAYESVHGNVITREGAASGEVAGVSLTPGMAISAKF